MTKSAVMRLGAIAGIKKVDSFKVDILAGWCRHVQLYFYNKCVAA